MSAIILGVTACQDMVTRSAQEPEVKTFPEMQGLEDQLKELAYVLPEALKDQELARVVYGGFLNQ